MDVYEELADLRRRGEKAAIATIVEVQGSIPSFQSAKMLIREDGSMVGTIGGGCTEAEVWTAAREVIESERPKMLRFNLGQDAAYDNGLICGGQLNVYVEPVLPLPSRLQSQSKSDQDQQQQDQQQGEGDQPGSPDQPDEEGDEEQEGPDGDREGVGEDPEGEQRGDGSEQDSQELERPGANPQQQEMTPGQALQFLEAVGQNTDTLQSYLQRQFAPTSPPERDW